MRAFLKVGGVLGVNAVRYISANKYMIHLHMYAYSFMHIYMYAHIRIHVSVYTYVCTLIAVLMEHALLATQKACDGIMYTSKFKFRNF